MMDSSEFEAKKLSLRVDRATDSGIKKYKKREAEASRRQWKPWERNTVDPEAEWQATFVKSVRKEYFNLSAAQANEVQNAIARLRRNPFREEVRVLQPFKNRFRCRISDVSIVFDLLINDSVLVVLGVSAYGRDRQQSTMTVVEKHDVSVDD